MLLLIFLVLRVQLLPFFSLFLSKERTNFANKHERVRTYIEENTMMITKKLNA